MPKDMVDHMTHMSQKMMDGVDQRIEGMEDMMKELQETVYKLTEKVFTCFHQQSPNTV